MKSHVLADRLAWLATALAAFAAAAGLLTNVYRDPVFWTDQARGTDLATLLLAIPLLVMSLSATSRGSATSRLMAFGATTYLVYNYAIYVFAVRMNVLAALYIAVFGLSVWSLALVLAAGRLPRLGTVPRRTGAAVLIGIAVVFALLWLGQIGSATITGVLPPDVERAELLTNPVFALDLGLFLPLSAVAGVGLLRRTSAGAFALPMLIWLTLTSAGIFAGFLLTAMRGESFPIVPALIVGILGLVAAAVAIAAIGASRSSAASSVPSAYRP